MSAVVLDRHVTAHDQDHHRDAVCSVSLVAGRVRVDAVGSYGVADAGAPAAGLVALYMPATIVTAIASCGLILLLTPTGALPSPGWRWWVGVIAATPVVVVLVVTLVSGPVADLPWRSTARSTSSSSRARRWSPTRSRSPSPSQSS
jgi:hypothetical protein